jgi:hypothetical protein
MRRVCDVVGGRVFVALLSEACLARLPRPGKQATSLVREVMASMLWEMQAQQGIECLAPVWVTTGDG